MICIDFYCDIREVWNKYLFIVRVVIIHVLDKLTSIVFIVNIIKRYSSFYGRDKELTFILRVFYTSS
jgi:hypothetical protein